jgi:hypothetical protein
VSTLMRNIEASPWLSTPELVEIKLVPMPGTRTPPEDQRIHAAFLIKRTAPITLKWQVLLPKEHRQRRRSPQPDAGKKT